MVPSGDGSMHQRLFHYAMLVYALGILAAITLNVDVSEQTASAPAEPGVKSAASNSALDCSSQPDVHVVASAPATVETAQAEIKAPCAARIKELPIPGAMGPKPAVIPVVEPLVRQEL